MEYFFQQLINGITLGSVYALIALGYTMVYGIIQLINFAHGEFFAAGGYVGLMFMSKSYVLLILSTIMIFGIAALGLNLLSGYAGQLSIGHGSFMAVGAYTTAMLSATLHLPFYVNLVAAVILSAILGLIIGLPALRLKGFYLAIATMAFGVAVEQLFAAGDFFGGHG